MASRAQELIQCCSLFREATTDAGRDAALQQIVSVAGSFRGQTTARRRTNPPPRKADDGPVAPSPIAPIGSVVEPGAAAPRTPLVGSVPVVARAARSAAVVSRALTREIVQAPWPPATLSPTTAARSSPELFVSSPPPLVCSPVALYQGDAVVSGALPLGAFPPPASPVFRPVVTPVTPPRPSPLPASPLPAASPIPSPAAAPSAALLVGLVLVVRGLAAAAEDISVSLRILVGSSFFLPCAVPFG